MHAILLILALMLPTPFGDTCANYPCACKWRYSAEEDEKETSRDNDSNHDNGTIAVSRMQSCGMGSIGTAVARTEGGHRANTVSVTPMVGLTIEFDHVNTCPACASTEGRITYEGEITCEASAEINTDYAGTDALAEAIGETTFSDSNGNGGSCSASAGVDPGGSVEVGWSNTAGGSKEKGWDVHGTGNVRDTRPKGKFHKDKNTDREDLSGGGEQNDITLNFGSKGLITGGPDLGNLPVGPFVSWVRELCWLGLSFERTVGLGRHRPA